MSEKLEHFKKFVQYTFTTLIGSAAEIGLVWIFEHIIFADCYRGWQKLLSLAVGFEVKVLINFTNCYLFVWKDRIAAGRSVRDYLKRYLQFNASCTTVFFLQMGIAMLLNWLSGWQMAVCDFFALMIAGLVNFAMSEWVIFNRKK